jgi:dTDP-4-amino-4,6-dideoxygalactose transaminase
MKKEIYVTRPFLPPLNEYIPYLEKIWKSGWLTNEGDFHKELESSLKEYLGVKYISVLSNGTLALIIALKALDIRGEVITTPFSFVATTHSLWWNGLKPVFVDIEPGTFTLDPDKIEEAITPDTMAVLPVHVYGNPCKINRLNSISKKYGLKIIYDAAHAFAVKQGNRSILNSGDLSILSFHATKVFNTFEGGAIVCHSRKMKERIDNLKNFGIIDELNVVEPGINAKLNEVQAAFGILSLKYIDDNIRKRKEVSLKYRDLLKNIDGLSFMAEQPGTEYNYSYFPILIDHSSHGKNRDLLYDFLKTKNIFTRKYFYPLISRFPFYKDFPSAKPENLPVAEKVANQVLCLPIYASLEPGEVKTICGYIHDFFS